MAERRMFAKTIIDSDAFLDMPLTTQALYFHLGMRADDDGFIGNPKRIQRMVGASDDDLKLLILKRFILTFDSGVIVIKHWWMHNIVKKDRFKQTSYAEEKSTLVLDDKKAYTEAEKQLDNQMEPKWNQSGTKTEPQVKVKVKDNIDKLINCNTITHACEEVTPKSLLEEKIDMIKQHMDENNLDYTFYRSLDYYVKPYYYTMKLDRFVSQRINDIFVADLEKYNRDKLARVLCYSIDATLKANPENLVGYFIASYKHNKEVYFKDEVEENE